MSSLIAEINPLVLAGIIVVGGYVASVFIHPYTKCKTCGGAARHRGAIFSWGVRPCHACSGTGQRQRLGAYLLGRGRRRRSTRRVQPPSDSF